MTRPLTPAMTVEITSKKLHPIYLCDFEFNGATLYLWTGNFPLQFNGNTYTGASTLLTISPAEETSLLEARNAFFTLSAVGQTEVAAVLDSSNYQGRAARVYFGALSDQAALIGNPHLIFGGRMDVAGISGDAENPVINMTAENNLIALRRPKTRRYTDEDQKLDYPNDRGFEFVTSTQDTQITW